MKLMTQTIAGLVYLIFAWPRNGYAQRSESITVDPRENEIPREDGKKYPKPAYKFGYSVFDPITMDVKSQWEHRDGDLVKGAYSLLDPDGLMRIVEYIADEENGFRAYIRKIPFDDIDSLKKSPAESPSLEEPDALDAFRTFPQKPISVVKIAPQKSKHSYRENHSPANKIKNNLNTYSSIYNNPENKQFPKKFASKPSGGQLYHLQSHREKQKPDGLDFFFNGPPTSAPVQTYNERPYDTQTRKPYYLREYSNDGNNNYQPENALSKYQTKAPANKYQSQYSAAKSVTNNPKVTYQNEGQNGRYQQEGQAGKYRQEGQPGRYRAEGQLGKYQTESSGKYQTERATPIKYEFENPESKYKPAIRQNLKPYVQRVEVLPNSRTRQIPWNQKLKTNRANQQPLQEYRPEVTTIQRQKFAEYQTEAPSKFTEVVDEYKDFKSDFSPNSQFVSEFSPSQLGLQPQPPTASYPYQYEPVTRDYSQKPTSDYVQNSDDNAQNSDDYAQKPTEYAQQSNDYSDKSSDKEYSQTADFQIPDISEFASEYGLEEPRGFSVTPNAEQEGTELMELNTPSALEDPQKPADPSSTNKPTKFTPHRYKLQQAQESQPTEKYTAQYFKTFIQQIENGQ